MAQLAYTARLDLPAGPPGVAIGRDAARLLLGGWGVADDGLLDRVELVISELVSNAVRHAVGPSALELALDRACVTAAVVDSNPDHPSPGRASGRGGGRGLPIIEAVSTRWGSHPVRGGKRVWAELEPDINP